MESQEPDEPVIRPSIPAAPQIAPSTKAGGIVGAIMTIIMVMKYVEYVYNKPHLKLKNYEKY